MLTYTKISRILSLIQRAITSKAYPGDMVVVAHTAAELLHMGVLIEQAADIVELNEQKLKAKRGHGKTFIERIPEGTTPEDISIFDNIVTQYQGRILSEGPSNPDGQLNPVDDQYHRARLAALLRYGYKAFGGKEKPRRRLDEAATILFHSVNLLPSAATAGPAPSLPSRAPFGNLGLSGGNITGRLDPHRAYELDQSEE